MTLKKVIKDYKMKRNKKVNRKKEREKKKEEKMAGKWLH